MKKVIKIVVPADGDSWKVTVGSGQKRKKNAIQAFSYVEKLIKRNNKFASSSPIKIKVLVDYSQIYKETHGSWINEGNYAQKNEALYMLCLFLEDYLPVLYRKTKERLYGAEYLRSVEIELNVIK